MFIKNSSATAAAVTFGGILPGFSAKNYNRIAGSNEKIAVASMGVNSRGYAVATNFAAQNNAEVIHVCDVDSKAADKCINAVEKIQNKRPIATPDFIIFSDLPKTRSGKIMRRILRKIAAGEEGSIGDITTLADPSIVDNIIQKFKNI